MSASLHLSCVPLYNDNGAITDANQQYGAGDGLCSSIHFSMPPALFLASSGNDTKMPDYVVLVSRVGGLATFGLNGLVIGPVIAAMFIAAWDIFSASREIAEDDGTIR